MARHILGMATAYVAKHLARFARLPQDRPARSAAAGGSKTGLQGGESTGGTPARIAVECPNTQYFDSFCSRLLLILNRLGKSGWGCCPVNN
jgi:hypothetical protein